jgi:pilus assembly protein Flp/PilA
MRSRRADKKGQGIIEYALMLVLVSIVVVVLLGVIGDRVNSTFSKVAGAFQAEPDEIRQPPDSPPECYSSLLLPIMVTATGLGVSISTRFPRKPIPVPVT